MLELADCLRRRLVILDVARRSHRRHLTPGCGGCWDVVLYPGCADSCNLQTGLLGGPLEAEMHTLRRDWIATGFVGAAVVAYACWLLAARDSGDVWVRVTAGVVLGLGFAASASAVVPGFTRLLHGSKAYLVVACLLGAGCLVAGVLALVGAQPAMLSALVALTVVLWLMATVRHASLASEATSTPSQRPPLMPGVAGR